MTETAESSPGSEKPASEVIYKFLDKFGPYNDNAKRNNGRPYVGIAHMLAKIEVGMYQGDNADEKREELLTEAKESEYFEDIEEMRRSMVKALSVEDPAKRENVNFGFTWESLIKR